jgi:hypothetical protein
MATIQKIKKREIVKMGDENLTNNENEGTAALFVSAQKKKKAEEEARKKAEEEQAKRDAAEAEVRRMEEEVEAKKRQVEEEKRAREQAEAQAQTKTPVQKIKSINVPEGKSKTPLFIGIGAAVVVVVLIAVFALGGKKGPAIDYDNISCNAEYKSKADKLDVLMYYPDSIYNQGVEESMMEGGGDAIVLNFKSDNSKAPVMRGLLIQSSEVTPQQMAMISKDMNEGLKEIAERFTGESQVTDEVISDLAASEPGNYEYKCKYTDEEIGNCALSMWYETNSKGNVVITAFQVGQKDGDFESIGKLLDAVVAKNTTDAIKTPGGNPPTTYDWDGHLDLEALQMRMPVPKDRFMEVGGDNDCRLFCDDNGAIVVMTGEALGSVDEIAITDSNVDAVKEMFEKISKTGLTEELSVDNRMYVGEKYSPYGHIDSMYEYRVQINGIPYWERDYLNLWHDDTTVYVATIFMYFPEKNKDVYKDIFERSIQDITDM